MFGWLKRRIEDTEKDKNLAVAFSRIKGELLSQKQALIEFEKSHHGFKSTTTLNHQRIAEWIAYFEKSISRIDKDLNILEARMRQDLEVLANTSLKLYGELHARNKNEIEKLKQELKRDLEVFMAENSKKQPVTPVSNVNNVDNVRNITPNITPEPSYDALSNPEKWLVGVLFNSEVPLSYNQIVERTGKQTSTVRVYMNQLKFKGFIDESTLPNGTKVFGLRHKAKVKKLYNL